MVQARGMKMGDGKGPLVGGKGPLVHDMVQARDMIPARGTLQQVQGGRVQARGSLMADGRGQGSCRGPERSVVQD